MHFGVIGYKSKRKSPLHQSLVPISLAEENIFKHFSIGSYVETMSFNCGHCVCMSGSSRTIIIGEYLRIHQTKFAHDWCSNFLEEDFK